MAVTGNTELLATKQDLISAMVQKELIAGSKLLPTISDMSMFAVKGAKTVSFPKLTSFTVEDRASGVAGTVSALTSSVDQLALDKNAYVSWLIDSSDEIQSTINAQLEFAKRAAAAHAKYVDQQIITELESVGVATTTAGDITLPIILEMRQALVSRYADLNKLYLAVGADQEAKMLAINEFIRADAYGSSNIPNGVIGTVFGIKVVVQPLLGAQVYYMYEQSGCAIAFQQAPNFAEEAAIAYGTKAKLQAVDQLFGVKGLQIEQAGVAAGKSALVMKDNN